MKTKGKRKTIKVRKQKGGGLELPSNTSIDLSIFELSTILDIPLDRINEHINNVHNDIKEAEIDKERSKELQIYLEFLQGVQRLKIIQKMHDERFSTRLSLKTQKPDANQLLRKLKKNQNNRSNGTRRQII
jgi:hypothetical protein